MPSSKAAVSVLKAPHATYGGYDRFFSPLCLASVLLSAFLLFEVELIIGKTLLPWFGGAPATWITCLLFFQVALLAGYTYAHKLAGTSAQTQAGVHLLLMGLSLVLLVATALHWRTPITPGAAWKPYVIDHPVWQVLKLLAASVGIPFLLLSATAPLLQSWFAKLRPNDSAYPLYALSNFGSLLALLAYPVLIEPNSTLLIQGWTWSIGYLLFALLAAGCGYMMFASHQVTPAPAQTGKASKTKPVVTPWFARILWIALPACASAMLLASTNLICQEVAVVPFLWVLPLALYLISFIASFARRSIYRRWIFHPLFAVAAIMVLFANRRAFVWEIGAYLFLLFIVCMVCHGEVVRLRPPASQLTSFYLWVAFGGALGSAFVSLVAPQVFTGLWEFPIALVASELVLVAALFYDHDSWFYESPAWLPVVLVWGLLLCFRAIAELYGVAGQWNGFSMGIMAVLSVATLILLQRHKGFAHLGAFRPVQFFVIAAIGMITFYSWQQMGSVTRGAVYASRNFFGTLRISREAGMIALKHGRTFHGGQFLNPASRDVPTSYYLADSGIGILMRNYPKRESGPLRVGLVGLGVGTLAAYGREGDYYRFYDINSDVYKLSIGKSPYFTFLADSKAKTDVEIGDARLLMEREVARGERQNFDILVLDAFNSDAIPVHLLTTEAVQLYLQHMKPDGVLAVHISNRSLNLAPVLAGLAQRFQFQCAEVDFNRPPMQASRWVLMARNGAMLELPLVKKWAGYGEPFDRAVLWTDDYSNLLRLLTVFQ